MVLMDSEAKETSPSTKLLLPRGPSRNPLHGKASTSKPDTSTATVLISPAKIPNVDKKDKSFNDTGENSPRIEDEETEENDYDPDNDPESFEDGDKNQQFRHSVERETDRQKDSQTSAPGETKQPPKYAISKSWVLAMVFAVLVIIIAIWIVRVVPSKETTVRQSCKNFIQLQSKYPNTDNTLWAGLIVGVERAVNDPGEPATFIFLYNFSSVGQSLLKDVIHITTECFGNEDAIWRTSNDFKSAAITQDYGVVLERHREELKSQGVLVVRDLDQVPPNAAQIFFTICDSYEPLVRKAAIFFTIDISQQLNQSQRSPTSIAEGILKDLWRTELHSNVLDPLVVRLTENVFKID
ncbi:uncharacterized protein TORIP [Ochlerotatus camptorhynchus]|uniref:uncharacterized protein TORIP n=1 Tax=Ochlerotatus camptorhynchus TaxID=644619 RepID=UPI0031D543DD